jgi:crotonobetainyl-CoA:carnitine CoA-transferase CaiB-like acyl-CoA transferase
MDQLFTVSDADVVGYRTAPRHGQHTEDILLQLGYGKDRIAALRSRHAAV